MFEGRGRRYSSEVELGVRDRRQSSEGEAVGIGRRQRSEVQVVGIGRRKRSEVEVSQRSRLEVEVGGRGQRSKWRSKVEVEVPQIRAFLSPNQACAELGPALLKLVRFLLLFLFPTVLFNCPVVLSHPKSYCPIIMYISFILSYSIVLSSLLLVFSYCPFRCVILMGHSLLWAILLGHFYWPF